MSKIKNNSLKKIITFVMLIVGSLVAAAALECFLIPNTILDGGITGISIILFKIFKIPLWLLVVVLNIPFIFIGYKNLGINFLYRTIISMVSFALFLSFFELIQPFTEEILLATIFGGALLGLGVGIVIHFGGCVDGTESVAIVISKKTSLSVGQVVLFFNLIIFGIAGFIFGFDRAMYSLLTYVITFKVIDFVSEGLEQAMMNGKGFISGEKEVLYCVLTRIEIFELRHLVEEMDESAFVTILDVSDIIGNHIKSSNKIRTVNKLLKR